MFQIFADVDKVIAYDTWFAFSGSCAYMTVDSFSIECIDSVSACAGAISTDTNTFVTTTPATTGMVCGCEKVVHSFSGNHMALTSDALRDVGPRDLTFSIRAWSSTNPPADITALTAAVVLVQLTVDCTTGAEASWLAGSPAELVYKFKQP